MGHGERQAEHDVVQDAVSRLLGAAVQTSDALDKLRALAARIPAEDVGAAVDVATAIETLAAVRTRLIRDADLLATRLPPDGSSR